MAGALWNEAREALSGIASLARTYDSDGIDIFFLNSPSVGRNLAVRRLSTNRATSDPPTERQGGKTALRQSSPAGYVSDPLPARLANRQRAYLHLRTAH